MTGTVTPRFVPRRSILIAIWVAIMILFGSLLFNRLAYTGIMVPISGVPEGISFGSDKLVFITTNRFSQATHFAVQVENTSPQTLASITLDARLLDAQGNVVGSVRAQSGEIAPGASQWVRGDFDQRGRYTQAEVEVASIEWR